MVASIILAAGEGKRMNSHLVNKVALPFLGKPMVKYAVELLDNVSDPVVVVIGAYSESVKDALKGHNVLYAEQQERLGTGDAVRTGLSLLLPYSPSKVLVGYGDHMMFYNEQTIQDLYTEHDHKDASISLITTMYEYPNELAWGRIVRSSDGEITDIIEQKDADELQKNIRELNAGFYCFNYDFLLRNIDRLEKSPVTNEYYINHLITLGVREKVKITSITVPFEQVGIGINRPEEIEKSARLKASFV